MAAMLSACASALNLEGTDWQLTELNGQKLPVYISITLGFKDGQAGGNASCNGYGGSYTLNGSALTIKDVFSTMMYCDGVMDYETDYLAALGEVRSFRLENDVLSLVDESGAVRLVFGKPQANPALDGTSWKAIQIGDVMVPEGIEVTVNFAEGQVTGRSACNSYFGNFSQQDAQLTIESIGMTEMFCTDEGVMDLEQAFLSRLAQVRSFQVQMGGIALLDANGAAVIYLKP